MFVHASADLSLLYYSPNISVDCFTTRAARWKSHNQSVLNVIGLTILWVWFVNYERTYVSTGLLEQRVSLFWVLAYLSSHSYYMNWFSISMFIPQLACLNSESVFSRVLPQNILILAHILKDSHSYYIRVSYSSISLIIFSTGLFEQRASLFRVLPQNILILAHILKDSHSQAYYM